MEGSSLCISNEDSPSVISCNLFTCPHKMPLKCLWKWCTNMLQEKCFKGVSLRWRHNDHAGVSNHQLHGCLLNRLFRRKSKKTSKLRVTGLCAGNSPGTGEFPAQMASYAENISIWWRHHVQCEWVFMDPDKPRISMNSLCRSDAYVHRRILIIELDNGLSPICWPHCLYNS